MMFLMMVRVDDPLVPRAMFGVLNTLLFFPSGAISPVAAFPKWLRAIAIVDPFTYAIHGFKAILLKDGGFVSIRGDLLFLFAFGIGTLLIATPLFKRTALVQKPTKRFPAGKVSPECKEAARSLWEDGPPRCVCNAMLTYRPSQRREPSPPILRI